MFGLFFFSCKAFARRFGNESKTESANAVQQVVTGLPWTLRFGFIFATGRELFGCASSAWANR